MTSRRSRVITLSTQRTGGVEVATRDDERAVIDTLVLAFSADPLIRWFYPSPHEYLHHFPEFVRIYGGRAFEHGSAYHVPEFSAAALWLPPTVEPDEDAFIALIESTVPEERRVHLWSVLEQLEEHRPTEPYWYLPLIGVDPTQQRKGYGSTLMEHALSACDRAGTLAYLESSNPENISLYARHGFEILGMVRAGSMPPLVPMLREPRA